MTNDEAEKTDEALIDLAGQEEERALLGPKDCWRRYLAQKFLVQLVLRDGVLKVMGEEPAVRLAAERIREGLAALRAGKGEKALERIFGEGESPAVVERILSPGNLLAGHVRPKSAGQQEYVKSLGRNLITIVVGPAGTGKTFLAVSAAVAALKSGAYRKLVLARPAVEAGERLGFLPGDMQAKVNPYLRPLYDSLFALLDLKQVQRYEETDVIEIVPLAYMRGRTLDRAFIILDEAQNTTPKQMKMFLTRMGRGSRIVVTGDVTQTDLPAGACSGLTHCVKILASTKEIGIVHLGRSDIVRHPLVQHIVDAYERDEAADASRARGGH
ncbi:MAG: PhoH family protein [Planctomycetota bacterium]